ncbi:hypothetical protein C4588_01085 [Candidatus Parcubacteria bacterium]|nr:MAG: hypothetical protein C4588_01085 [Candidatus Parcubacteria bacterium]
MESKQEMGSNSRKKTVAIDLDGTLAEYHGWRNGDPNLIGNPRPGAIAFVYFLHGICKWEIWVFSARAGTEDSRKTIWEWLESHRLDQCISGVTTAKSPEFDLFIDDRAISFEGQFDTTFLKKVLEFRAYWEEQFPKI